MWIKYDNRAKGDGSAWGRGCRGLIFRVGDGESGKEGGTAFPKMAGVCVGMILRGGQSVVYAAWHEN